ncbi:MAG: sigma 54-interacting transcriptional regulator [Planctomycetota bacterium]
MADTELFLADAASHDEFGFAASVQRLGLRSIACLPIRAGDGESRLLYVDSPLETGAFDGDAREALRDIATLAALAFDLRGNPRRETMRREITSQRRALESRSLELEQTRERLGRGVILGVSDAARALTAMIRRVAETDLDVLVVGESGVGKELVAEAIHERSPRSKGPLLRVNVAALPASLFESELFGHTQGAFTGAVESAPGLFRLAEGGTLFLDEVGALPVALQAKLLRVIETRRVRPLGGTRRHPIDVRVVAASNRPLRGAKDFREDLYYRLARFELAVAPLRERRADLPLLVREFARRAGRPELAFTAEAWSSLEAHAWPGNVRELQNLVARLAVLVGGEAPVGVEDLPAEIRRVSGARPVTVDEAIETAIRDALAWAGGSRAAAARALGISRSTLYKRMEAFGMEDAE